MDIPPSQINKRFAIKLARLTWERNEKVPIELIRFASENHDNCTKCGYMFEESDTSYWGFGSAGDPMYVCKKCSPDLAETVRREYFMARWYKVPEAESILWRYMDFTKFVSLLSTKTLYFPSAVCFDDIWEGTKGLRKNKWLWDEFFLDSFRNSLRTIPTNIRPPLSDEEIESEAIRMLRELEEGGELDRKRTFISCWHENEFESEAMWKLYSSSVNNAIAIRTTYERLYQALGRDPEIKIGRVEYVDLHSDFVDVNAAFWRKQKSFEHEREVRALLMKPEHIELGLAIPCNVEKLIERVIVSPLAPKWFFELVDDVSTTYEFKLTIEKSSLIQDVFF